MNQLLRSEAKALGQQVAGGLLAEGAAAGAPVLEVLDTIREEHEPIHVHPHKRREYVDRAGPSTARLEREVRKEEKELEHSLGNFIPAATADVVRTVGPRVGSRGNHMVVGHREYMGEVTSSTAFEGKTYPVTPVSAVTFPWLQQIAHNYETYRFTKVTFEYEPAVGTNQAGTVFFAMIYDPLDDPPVDKNDVLQRFNSVRSPLYHAASMKCDYENLNKVRNHWTSSANLIDPAQGEADLRLTMVGRLFVGTEGAGTIFTAGDLWVTYEVEFATPQWSPSSWVFNHAVNYFGETGFRTEAPIAFGLLDKATAAPNGAGNGGHLVRSGLSDVNTNLYLAVPGYYLWRASVKAPFISPYPTFVTLTVVTPVPPGASPPFVSNYWTDGVVFDSTKEFVEMGAAIVHRPCEIAITIDGGVSTGASTHVTFMPWYAEKVTEPPQFSQRAIASNIRGLSQKSTGPRRAGQPAQRNRQVHYQKSNSWAGSARKCRGKPSQSGAKQQRPKTSRQQQQKPQQRQRQQQKAQKRRRATRG